MKKLLALSLLLLHLAARAEDGYRLWLRYDKVADGALLRQYQQALTGVHFPASSPTLAAAREELVTGLTGLLGKQVQQHASLLAGTLLAGTPATLPLLKELQLPELATVGKEGFIIRATRLQGKPVTVVVGNTDQGVLYGVFHLLRQLQTARPAAQWNTVAAPRIQHRVLNHWDNLDRTVERGYAGFSIWDWHRLPGYIDPRYKDYARANASIGINGTVLTNVNANALLLTPDYLRKVAVLAGVFRPYGIRVFLTARFSAPVEIGGLKTADPLDPAVQQWWKEKTTEIYRYVPDFGGFVVKANSEGQPGPQNYGRTHADGANMLADAMAPHGGTVMWRAFVYSNETPEDRVKQAYSEFKPLDGQFRKNVMVQVKNGPLDFQPREPFHPLFGAMPKTPMVMEFQLTQEYLGQATHLVYQGPLYKEMLDADTYAKGSGSNVARVVDGSLHNQQLTGIAGVANIGNDRNWTGHLFGQSNWYLFGRLAWDHQLGAKTVAEEWTRQTFGNTPATVAGITNIMMASHEALVNYMTPLGLAHIMGYGHHYGPAPWWDKAPRADWLPVYFHRADSGGIGFDRTAKGSHALEQYAPELGQLWGNRNNCPEEYLLWFHRVGWKEKMRSGKTLWDEMATRYQAGVDQVRRFRQQWEGLKGNIDAGRFEHVRMLLGVQEQEAVWWRNACLLYFQTFSRMPLPAGVEPADQTLEYYKSLRFPYAPGN